MAEVRRNADQGKRSRVVMPRRAVRGKHCAASFSHIADDGAVRMVDVSSKPATVREATASAVVTMSQETLGALLKSALPKGEALAAARLAGIAAAKRTSSLIPLCHTMALEWADVQFETHGAGSLLLFCTARTSAKTGVEMEALVGAAVAALTIYDMAKSADKSIVIGPIQLERKSGGRSGNFERKRDTARQGPRRYTALTRPRP